MKKLVAISVALTLSSCAWLIPNLNSEQTPEQKLQNTCLTIHDAIDDALVYDLGLDALNRLNDVKAVKDSICRKDGPALEGFSVETATRILESELEKAYRIKRESGK